ncbi:Replicative DNA helicase [Prochlorococcus sp. MIT 0602]|nr:Replicative DNA helicase [Prochlorococcus sp. MIT 0602]
MMMYQDEYYNPETIDGGITEFVVCKPCNGPIGTVKLLFETQYTRFRNVTA